MVYFTYGIYPLLGFLDRIVSVGLEDFLSEKILLLLLHVVVQSGPSYCSWRRLDVG